MGNEKKKGETDKQTAPASDDTAELERLGGTTEDRQQVRALKNIELTINKGDVVGITGPVGSGKTALIKAILGELQPLKGHVSVDGRLAYAPQQPWVFSGTVRDNITFHAMHDSKRYQEVVAACCLEHDLLTFPAGDLTQIGERGTNLSGGQKHRISIARAVYSNRDICLLDDPFSALDPDVADDIHAKVIQDTLLGKTVIMVTSETKYLSECDHVVLLDGGEVLEHGPPQELQESGVHYAKLVEAQQDRPEDAVDAVLTPNATEEHRNSKRISKPVEVVVDEASHIVFKFDDTGQPLLSQEEKEEGSVSKGTYRDYIRAAGGVGAVVITLVLSFFAEGCRAFSVWWLGKWLADGSGNTTITEGNVTYISSSISDNPLRRYYTIIYGVSLLAILLVFAVRSVIIVKLMMKASSALHDALFRTVMHAPMSFFDMTPHGRIINRFSKDQDELDSGIPPMVDTTIKNCAAVVLYLILIGVVIHWFLIVAPIMMTVFVFVYILFRVGARETKRLQNLSMSPLLSHVTATIQGLACVRAFNKEEDFLKRFWELLDNSTAALIIYTFVMRWINIRLTLITATIVCVTALLLVLLRDTVEPEFAGVALIYAVQLTALLQFLVRSAVESEARFTSAERITSYINNLEQEQLTNARCATPSHWPSEGEVKFCDYSMRYRDDLPLALDGITCTVKANENMAVVGRTGAGKSSLSTALFRICEAAGGCIKIDGIDISHVGLTELRSNISIIPQDPVLFSGTIRDNLDPFRRHIDHELWHALEKCQLKAMVSGLEGELDADVTENGANLSVGERQLLCLARVLLSRTRILILDEATAAMDGGTAQQIQQCLHAAFTDCTILVITHTLDVVRQCNRVMVIDGGKLVELDEAETLWKNTSSKFYQLMASTKAATTANEDQPEPNEWV